MQTKTAQRITRLKLGTNTLHALLVNDHPVVTVTPDGLSIDPRFGARLSETVDWGYRLHPRERDTERRRDRDRRHQHRNWGRRHAGRVAGERTAHPD